ncbi:MAG: indolepyruvate oxidoreductase subunit beta family protein [Arenicellales bacterium]|nr:indolepyruvate oxidoreductase subunit beta family protein [Arenicellales bacterium]
MNPSQRPVCVLIAALGGEGGGLLTSWIVDAATACNLPVQSTSIPGVAQRTGATTYYIEIFPQPFDQLDGSDPVMGLYPAPGRVDIMVASELLEAARALENGFVTPDRTTLVASTHRVYAISEKSNLTDGRYDEESVQNAIAELSHQQYCSDFLIMAQQRDSALNAVLLGLVANTKQLPIPTEAFVDAIKDRGIAVDSNLRGFQAGLGWTPGREKEIDEPVQSVPAGLPDSLQRRVDALPAVLTDIVRVGAARVMDFQDIEYAELYLDRVDKVTAIDSAKREYALGRETARYLALWMTYEDIIRVADLKSRPERYLRVREEIQAKPHEPVLINEFLKPGVDEFAAVLPEKLGRSLRNKRDRLRWLSFSLRLGSHTILGHLLMRLLAGCRRWRRKSLRWQEEQALIERWLDAVCRAAEKDYAFGLEAVLCANLNKGYGDTFARGRGNFLRILESLIESPLRSESLEPDIATRLKSARTAALSDDTGAVLDAALPENVAVKPD